MKEGSAEHLREERQAIGDVRADKLRRLPRRWDQLVDGPMRLAIDLYGDRRNPGIADIELIEFPDVEGDVACRELARPARRRHVAGRAGIDEPSDGGELQTLGRVKRHREGGALLEAVPRIPVARRFDERPAVENRREFTTSWIPPGRKEIVHRRTERDQIAVIGDPYRDGIARAERLGDAQPELRLMFPP